MSAVPAALEPKEGAAQLPIPGLASAQSLRKLDCEYTACYCEENVFKLLQKLSSSTADGDPGELYAVFLSNRERQVEIWCQQIGRPPHGHVMWDYHVILLQCKTSAGRRSCNVWDLDSTLPFPAALSLYHNCALRPPKYSERLYRVVPSAEMLRNFASDRSHMLDARGVFMQAPPNYPPLVSASQQTMTLPKFLDFSAGPELLARMTAVASGDSKAAPFGVVLREADFLAFFSEPHSR
mmetsp:Transcript_12373/g.34754  ORF Transcript_12373/g.34754 Transcript_12373/m.34754 type:complete len:238 (+) Transcript_12373:766-1479(+)|eukprot:CAMPEP_0117659650 /NCGR_PEP_ID=MMETSP0804-20121206/6544_1 /TAXON_ID=1074897 /ORGANISM="Tetraselmis astigmatica, Strain CCMP880" /LENGTH=237 /DNA_ID=CAMNT_0005466319 /DNA_START=301 /DNA_END=1014 /DNA_ORIENTATION=+